MRDGPAGITTSDLPERHDDGDWAGYSYAWDVDGREATLLTAGETRTIDGAPWIFPDRSECMYCHSEAAGFSLGLETSQLLRTIPGSDGPVDQLDALVELGLLGSRPSALPLPASDGEASLEARARAYLHVNCSPCHRPDGPSGRARMDLRFTTPLAAAAICDQGPRAGDLGSSPASAPGSRRSASTWPAIRRRLTNPFGAPYRLGSTVA